MLPSTPSASVSVRVVAADDSPLTRRLPCDIVALADAVLPLDQLADVSVAEVGA